MNKQFSPIEVKKRRNADYKLVNKASAWESSIHPEHSTCANIRSQIEPDDYDKSFGASVSPAYVLARLCALIPNLKIETYGQEAYKVTWQVVLKHKETGHVLTLYDYKGGISYGSDISGKETPKAFIKDVKALLKALSNERCPHPYDGCVVGEIA